MKSLIDYIKTRPAAILLILFLIAAGGCFANQDDGVLQSQLNDPLDPGAVKTGRGTLAGFVVSDANNRFGAANLALASVEKAVITLVETGLFTYTDSYGYYEFQGLAPGSYTVLAKRNDTEGSAYINYTAASVRPDEKSLQQTIVLKKSASIAGRVVTLNGTGASGFLISVENFPAAAISSEEGHFRLDAAPAEQDIYLLITGFGYKAERYGPLKISESKLYSINENITIEPVSAETSSIKGAVSDASTGIAVPSVFIKLYESAGGVKTLYSTAYTDSAGKFSISAAVYKNYIIELAKQDYFSATSQASLTSAVPLTLDLKLVRAKSDISGFIISGKVTDSSGAAVSGAKISSVPYSEQVLSGPDGTYKLRVSEGIYDIYASSPGSLEAAARVNARLSEKGAEINFTLQKSGATALYLLSGIVTDVNSSPLAGAKISVDKNNLYTYTNQSGNYSIYLSGGTYEINATNGAGLEKNVTYFMGHGPQRLDIKIIK
ncbi:MAG: hypothetical protein BWY32_02635 [bacterium ADurb.Bin243]|nr:MAG: hypothetical protein BWY32_02635 [bacterium ADurb.Bin243]